MVPCPAEFEAFSPKRTEIGPASGNQSEFRSFSIVRMDVQYYKRLLVSISGIYSVYLSFGLVQEKMWRNPSALIS